MKAARGISAAVPAPSRLPGRSRTRVAAAPRAAPVGLPKAGELAELRARLTDAEEALRAIRGGEVDAVVVAGRDGPQVFTLRGAEHAYRVLIESMNEGALTLTADKTILYANRSFARMVKCPLEQVLGSSFRRFLSEEDRVTLRPLLKRAGKTGAKLQIVLKATDGSQIPVQVSIRPLAENGSARRILGLVVTDLTEAGRVADLLRALAHRVVDALEAERGRVALELHDNITQHLCAAVFGCQTLAERLPARASQLKQAAKKLETMLGQTAEEVERISRDLRPGVLVQLGLVAVLRSTSAEFAHRTGIAIKLICRVRTARLPADTELALFRILQEILRNVERHASARHVIIGLTQKGAIVRLVINDDGVGFGPDPHPTGRSGQRGLGLLSISERATYVGGTFKIKSVPGAGTEVAVTVPLPTGTNDSNRGGGRNVMNPTNNTP